MKNRKFIIIVTVLLLIGGGALYWSQTHKVEYAIEASESIAESLGDGGLSENQVENGEEYAQNKEESLKSPKSTVAKIKTSSEEVVQEASVGAVDLAVQFYNPEKNVEDFWIFNVAMDTHSVDLDQIDLQESVYFIDGDGKIIEEGFKVKKSGSGHHISQYVELPKHINGVDTIFKEFKSFKMVFKNIDGVKKTELEWDMTVYPEIFDH